MAKWFTGIARMSATIVVTAPKYSLSPMGRSLPVWSRKRHLLEFNGDRKQNRRIDSKGVWSGLLQVKLTLNVALTRSAGYAYTTSSQ
jgi:hypothetical protein